MEEDYIYALRVKEKDYELIDIVLKPHKMYFGTYPEAKLSEARIKVAKQKKD